MTLIDFSADLPRQGVGLTTAQFSNQYDRIEAVVNGNIDDGNFADDAGINLSKFAQGGAASGNALVWDGSAWSKAAYQPSKLAQDDARYGQVLVWNGSAWQAGPGNGATVYRKTTEKDVVSSTSELDLLNDEITIPAGAFGTTKILRAILFGDYLNNTGGTRDEDVKVKLGSTTVYGDQLRNTGVDADRRAWQIRVVIAALGSASAQAVAVQFRMGDAVAATTGTSTLNPTYAATATSLPNTDAAFSTGMATATVDTSVACAFKVTVQHGLSDANLSWRLKAALLEIL